MKKNNALTEPSNFGAAVVSQTEQLGTFDPRPIWAYTLVNPHTEVTEPKRLKTSDPPGLWQLYFNL